MPSERWLLLERVFDESAQRPPALRPDVIARLCGADEALRLEARSLLDASDRSGEFLSNSAFERLAEDLAADGWSLRPGERVGAYVVDRMLGSGGSGEVWRARDDRLGRHVAIKVLLPHVANDGDRLRRFVDEARTAGALNHSNVLAVYDIGEHRGRPFLVSEWLEGQSLRKRLEAGPLPLDEAVTIALAIARGLAAAHARGIVHRDLKPDNVFLRSDGGVKILDFGLAKLHLPISPLNARSHTITGVIVGTAGYMAPEQVQGQEVDARADLFALGATLYEMIAGQRPFKGASTVETLHAILTMEPPPLASAERPAPSAISTIVTRLLKKSPDARFQSAGDLAWALEQASLAAVDDGLRNPARREERATAWRRPWIWTAALAIAAAAAMAIASWLRPQIATESRPHLAHFTWQLPSGVALDSAPVVSPDSQSIVFAGRDATGSRLFTRKLRSLDAAAIPGTEWARAPFWSPDSAAVGFFARGKLMKVTLARGVPEVICDAPESVGGAWGRQGRIVFQPNVIDTGLFRVSAEGGSMEPATLLDASHGETSHRWPVFLSDGVHFLYFVRSSDATRRGVYVGRVDRPAAPPDRPLFQSESEAVYVTPSADQGGVLLSVARGSIEARPFDAARLALTGDAQALPFRAGGLTPHHSSMLSASFDVLTFAATSVPYGNRFGAVDRNGEHLQLGNEREIQGWPRVSPDGRRLVRQRLEPAAGNPDLWVDDLERGTRVRVTVPPEMGVLPVWSPDGRILIVNVRNAGRSDIWSVATGSGASQPMLAEPYVERDARLSPDGRWIAYVSEEAGRPEVSVRSLFDTPRRVVISGEGGDHPVWRRDGAELFFVDPHGRLRSVAVRQAAAGNLAFGVPVELNVPTFGAGHFGRQYDISPDGRRIYFMYENDDAPPREINVVTDWRALLTSSSLSATK
jgi:serine/threonine protein kinase